MRAWLVSGFILTVYLALFAALPKGVFYSPDAGGKYLQMLGYHWAEGLQCDIIYPGNTADPDHWFYGRHAGRAAFTTIYPHQTASGVVHAGWAPWFPLLVLPFYQVLGVVGLHVIPLTAGLLLIGLTWMLAERLRHGTGLFAAAFVGLASPVLFYSLCFWEHTLAVSLVLAALLPLVRVDSDLEASSVRPLQWCLSGALMLAACALRHELVLFLGSTVLAWAWPRQRRRSHFTAVLFVLLASGAGAIAIFLHNSTSLIRLIPANTHAIQRLGMLLNPDLWPELIPRMIQILLIYDFDNLLPQPAYWAGLLGLACCLLNPFAPARWRRGMVLIGAALVSVPATWLVFTRVRYRALNSLLLPAPLALFALLPSTEPTSSSRRRLGWAVLMFAGAATIVLPVVVGGAHGGIEWGSRYALVAIVLLTMLGAVAAIETLSTIGLSNGMRTAVTVLSIWLVFLGAASVVRGVHELRITRRDLLAVQTELQRIGDPVVTDVWWLSASLAPYASRHEVYTLSEMHTLQHWLDLIGPRRPHFTFAGIPPHGTLVDTQGTLWLRQECIPTYSLPITRFHRSSEP